jgi:uncharacterized sulfatase
MNEPSAKRPNIIFFFSDQQRADTVGAYGQPLDVTPNLDRMADEGVRFEYAFTCQPVCGPARAVLQTGQWATETDCYTNNRRLPEDAVTLAKLLRAEGYEAGYIGKWHLASGPEEQENYRTAPVPPARRGGYDDFWIASDVLEFTSHGYGGHMFDAEGNKVEWDEETYRVDAQTDIVLDYLRTRDGQRPFFLFLSYIEPHHQNDRNRYEGPEGSKERWADYTPPRDLQEAPEAGDWRENYPDYLGQIHSLDANLGRIRDELDRLGIAENTLLLYTSDHGSHFRTRNGEYKRSCHEASVRIPMIAAGPGFAGGKVVESLASLIDIPPTILAAAGMDVHPQMRGRPLQETLDAEPDDWRDEVYIQISEDHIGRAIRTRKWKYEVWVPSEEKHSGRHAPNAEVYHEYHLYDLETDPFELNDLVRDPAYADVRAELAGRIKRRIVQAGEPEAEILPAT